MSTVLKYGPTRLQLIKTVFNVIAVHRNDRR